jgi:hypothetical protein
MAADAAWRNRITRHADVPPAELVAHPLNARRHPKHQADALSGVLSQVGLVQSVIVNERTGRMLDGHLRAELAVARNEPSVPVAYVDLDEQEERLVLATFDPLGSLVETNAESLATLLDGVTTEDAALASMLAALQPVTFRPDGESNGQLPDERLDIYDAATIRQITLHYPSDEHREAVDLLERLRAEYSEDNNATAVLLLLRERYDAAP